MEKQKYYISRLAPGYFYQLLPFWVAKHRRTMQPKCLSSNPNYLDDLNAQPGKYF